MGFQNLENQYKAKMYTYFCNMLHDDRTTVDQFRSQHYHGSFYKLFCTRHKLYSGVPTNVD